MFGPNRRSAPAGRVRLPSVNSLLPLTVAIVVVMGCGRAADAPSDTPSDAAAQARFPAGAQVMDGSGVSLGSISFGTTCSQPANDEMRLGMSLLHHMTYTEAEAAFAQASELDPDCALSYWGRALSYLHPLWPDVPPPAAFDAAGELLAKAREVGTSDARETAYIEALDAYYSGGKDMPERARLARYAEAWSAVAEAYPDDPEAALFKGLTLIATASATDRTYSNRVAAGEIAEAVLGSIPDHPGAHHYAIHAYDVPTLAERALSVARNYGAVAPENAHALHMTSHIFTRVGLWEESIEFNVRSAAAAARHPIGGAVSHHHLHALDYLAYAHLQRGDVGEAAEVMDHLVTLGPAVNHAASAYTFAAVPVRIALERGQWSEAAAAPTRWPETIGWDGFPHLEAIAHFGRAMGAARTGDFVAAQSAIDRLETLAAAAAEVPGAYDWATQVEIQRLGAEAWTAYGRGEADAALQLMTEAADLEATTEKNPVTPGEVLPARELLGDMLMELNRFAEAGDAYRMALARSPGRLNSLFGVGRAAEMDGDDAVAREFYQRLLDGVVDAAAGLPEVEHARDYLSQ